MTTLGPIRNHERLRGLSAASHGEERTAARELLAAENERLWDDRSLALERIT
jgi:hypothetical protein